MVGVSTTPRTGMFALLNTGVSVAMLADLTDETSFPSQIAFGLANGVEMVGVSVSGDQISTAIANKASNGIDSFGFKFLFGDWVFWLDTINNQQRLVSPQGFAVGELVALSPQNSPLNKQLQGIIGTQKSLSNQQYSNADLQALIGAGIDVIANPSPGGSYFSLQAGHNSSSNPLQHGDAYTRMINFLAVTFLTGMGQFVGDLDSPTIQAELLATLSAFLDNLADQGMIGNSKGTTPYAVFIDPDLNPDSQIALGNLQISAQVQFLAVIENLIINVQGGSSVQIQSVGITAQQ
jgi:phage tail sheath protein FI